MNKVLAFGMAAVFAGTIFTAVAADARWGRRGSGSGECNGPCAEETVAGDEFARGRRCFDGSGEKGFRRGSGRGAGAVDLEGFEGRVDKSEEAAKIVESFIASTGNPNLAVGKISEAGRDFEVEIVTKKGGLANKVYVEKRSGRIVPFYR